VPDVCVLVPGAGSGQSNNLIRGLRAGHPSLCIVGYHHDRFLLTQSPADRSYYLPPPGHPRFVEKLRSLIEIERIDLLIPTLDKEVELFARLRPDLPCRLFLPPLEVIRLCQDKHVVAEWLREHDVPVPATCAIESLDDLDEAFARLGSPPRLWCRSRSGADSRGAAPVKRPEQARSWIAYWAEMRGMSPSGFVLAEYLPGRDYACQMLWRGSQLVLVKTYERLDYVGGASRPSGTASRPSLAKSVREPAVVEIGMAAIRAVDPLPNGAYDVDLKEDAHGTPRVTEINAGRLLSSQTIFDLSGRYNMSAVYVQLAMERPVDIDDPYDVVEGDYMVRDVDLLPTVINTTQLFDRVLEID
jgi:carbamoyl-phosphate synthase large subunit